MIGTDLGTFGLFLGSKTPFDGMKTVICDVQSKSFDVPIAARSYEFTRYNVADALHCPSPRGMKVLS